MYYSVWWSWVSTKMDPHQLVPNISYKQYIFQPVIWIYNKSTNICFIISSNLSTGIQILVNYSVYSRTLLFFLWFLYNRKLHKSTFNVFFYFYWSLLSRTDLNTISQQMLAVSNWHHCFYWFWHFDYESDYLCPDLAPS